MLARFSIAAALVAAGLAFLPEPAKADSFVFGYSSGERRHYHHRPPPRHHHHHPYHSYRSHWSYNYYRPLPPPVYYGPPPVVYAPPVYATPPVYAAPPVLSAVPASPVYVAPNGQYCREYQGGVTVGGQPQRGYGTACLMPDGSWRVMN